MNCPQCQGDSKVLESRPFVGGVRRRRECLSCKTRFLTHEVCVAKKQNTVAKPREEKKLPPLVKTVEGKRRPEVWPEDEIPDEVLPDEFFNLGKSVYGTD